MITYEVTIRDLNNSENIRVYRDVKNISPNEHGRGYISPLPMPILSPDNTIVLKDLNDNKIIIPITPGFIYEIQKKEDLTGLTKEDLLGNMFLPKYHREDVFNEQKYSSDTIRVVVDVKDGYVKHVRKGIFKGLDIEYNDSYRTASVHEFQTEYDMISGDDMNEE